MVCLCQNQTANLQQNAELGTLSLVHWGQHRSKRWKSSQKLSPSLREEMPRAWGLQSSSLKRSIFVHENKKLFLPLQEVPPKETSSLSPLYMAEPWTPEQQNIQVLTSIPCIVQGDGQVSAVCWAFLMAMIKERYTHRRHVYMCTSIHLPELRKALLQFCRNRIVFQQISSQCRTPGNERAGKLASKGAQGDQPDKSFIYSEKRSLIRLPLKPWTKKNDYTLCF